MKNLFNRKNYKGCLLLAICFVLANVAKAQNPPGNITTDLELWYDAADINGDGDLTNNPPHGFFITTWFDKSGNGNDAYVHNGQDPGVMESRPSEMVNGRPLLKFNRTSKNTGTVYDTGLDIRSGSMEDFTLFLVYKPKTATSSFDNKQAPWGVDNGGWDRFYYSSIQLGGNTAIDGTVSLGTANSPPYQNIPEAGKIDELYLMTTAYNGSVTGTTNSGPVDGSAVYFNGDVVTYFTDTSHPTAAYDELMLGWDGNDGVYDGQIAEILVYSRILTDCEIAEINIELGLKYGKDFSGFASSYDNTNFPLNVNAIGTSATACGPPVIVNESSSEGITINNPSSNDMPNEFLIFGHNDFPLDQVSLDTPAGTTVRLERAWAVEEETNTNINGPEIDLGTVDIIFDVSAIGLSDIGGAEFYLLIDKNSGLFNDATIAATGTYANGELTFTGIDLEHNDIFTLAIKDTVNPIPTIDQSTNQLDINYVNNEAVFTISFNEAIQASSLTCEDIVNSGTATASCIGITQVAPFNNTTFEVTYITTTEGTVVLNLPENTVQDIAGNNNATAILLDNSVTVGYYTWEINPITSLNGNEYYDSVVYTINLLDINDNIIANTSEETITAAISFSGSADLTDFTEAFPTTISIAPYESGTTVTLPVLDDFIIEPTETLTALIESPSLGDISTTNNFFTANILDNDDTDNDGVPNNIDICPGFDDAKDNDNDGVPDGCDLDDDNDGIYDTDECEVIVTNIALGSTATQSSKDPIFGEAELLIDNNTDPIYSNGSTAHTLGSETTSWITVDLGSEQFINEVVIWNRLECCSDRLTNAYLMVSNTPFPTNTNTYDALVNASFIYQFGNTTGIGEIPVTVETTGRYVRIQKSGNNLGGNALNIPEMYILQNTNCDTDNDGIPDHLDLDSDGDGCSDANEFYRDQSTDGGDDEVFGIGNPMVNATDGTIISASYVAPVVPEILVTSTSEDPSGTNINEQGVNLGDNLVYLLTFKNEGTDGATNFQLENVLPPNIIFDRVDTSNAPGVTSNYDLNSHTVTFQIPDELVEMGDPEYAIRIQVHVAPNCSDFIAACSSIFENVAYATYEGILNPISFTTDNRTTTLNACNTIPATNSNFLLDFPGTCAFTNTVLLCGDNVVITAGQGFDTYTWEDAEGNVINDGDPDNDPSTLYVTEIGTFIVRKEVIDPTCADLSETIIVERFGETQTNPLVTYFDSVNNDANLDNDVQGEIVSCSIDGGLLPKIFLCGEGDTSTIQLGIADADSIVWELLDEASCDAAGDDCANKNNTCTWNVIGTNDNFTITNEGKYRVVVSYQNGCFNRYYFNVFQNDLDIEYTKSDIFCGNLGNISVNNLGTGYGYQLVDLVNNTIVVPFSSNQGPSFDINNKGEYQVQVVQLDPTTGLPILNACIFSTPEIGVLEREFEVDVISVPANCNQLGSITVQALNVFPNYSYELRLDDGSNGGLGLLVDDETAQPDNNYTFNNVNPGNYIVIGKTEDGCYNEQTITVTKIEDIAVTANTISDIRCFPGIVDITVSGGLPDPDYKIAIWSKDGTQLYNDISAIPEDAFQSTTTFNFGYESSADPSDPLVYVPGEDGDYVFIAIDSNNCYTLSNSITINDLGDVSVSITGDPITCADTNTASIVINATGGLPPYSYSIDNGLTFQDTNTFVNLPAGSYEIMVKDTGLTFCSYTEVHEITQPFALSASAAITQTLACNPTEGAQVQILNVTGGTAPYSYSFDGGANFDDTSSEFLMSGTYNIVVKDAVGCLENIELIIPDPVVAPEFTELITYDCDGQGAVTITSSNTTDFTYTYALNGVPNTPADSPDFSGLTSGLNTITVGYASAITPNQSTLLLEDFGAGPTTSIPEVESNYCYEPQDGSNPDCNRDNTISIADGEYSVTSNIERPYGSWTVPNDHTGDTDGRYLAMNIGDIAGVNGILYAKRGIEVLPNLDMTISLWAFNISTLAAPDVLIELVDGSGNVVAKKSTGNVPRGVNADDWHNYIVALNPGANTTIDFVLRTNININSGNDLALDDIQVSQTPEVCEETIDLEILIENDKAFSATLIHTANVTCNGANDGSATFEVFNFDTLTGIEYSVDNGTNWTTTTDEIITTGPVLAPGTQTITIRKVADTTCTTAITVIVEEPDPIVITALETNPYTCLNTGATISTTVTGGTGPFTYQLEDTAGAVVVAYNTTNSFNNIPDGSYLVRVQDQNGCTTLLTNPLVIPPPEAIDFTLDVAGCTSGNNDGSLVVNVISGNENYQFRINAGAWLTPTPNTSTTYTFENLTAGTYNVEVKDGFGCTPVQKTITINQQLRATTLLQSNLTCLNDASITINAVGGSGNYSYEWSNTNTGPWNTSGFNTNNFTTNTPGSYFFRVTDDTSPTPCSWITNAVEVAPAIPPVITSITPTNLLCNGDNSGSFTITTDTAFGLAPFTFNVINTSTGVDYGIQTSGLAAGDYIVTLTDSKGCFVIETATIDEPDAINYTTVTVPITCNPITGVTDAGSISINGTTGGTAEYTYYLSANNGIPTQTYNTTATNRDHTFDILTFGIYKVDVIDVNGCSAFSTEIIASPPDDLDIDLTTSTANCADGGTAIVDVSTTGGSGNYEFGILEDFNSPYTSNYYAPDVAGGNSITFSLAANGVYLTPGINYTFVVHDLITGCYYFESAQTPIDSPSNMTTSALEVDNVSCTGAADGKISFTIENYDVASTSIDYQLFNSQSNIAASGLASINVNPPTGPIVIDDFGSLVPGEYYLLLTENGGPFTGCSVLGAEFTIRESARLLEVQPSVTNNDNCNLNAGVITAVGRYGAPPYEYQIVTDGATAPTLNTWAGSTSNVFNTEGGTYDVYIKDTYNCIQMASIVLPTDPNPEISLSLVDDCADEGDYEILVTLDTATTGPYAISVNGSAFQNISFIANQYTITGLSSAISQTVEIKDLNGCGETEPFTIYPKLRATASITKLLDCSATPNAEFTINAFDGSGSFDYEINGPGMVNLARTTLPATNTVVWNGASVEGSYQISVYDNNTPTCTAKIFNLEVAAPLSPSFTETHIDITCSGNSDGAITLAQTDTGVNPLTYAINPLAGAWNETIQTFENLPAGTYDITATGTNGCTTVIPGIIINEPDPIVLPVASVVPFGCTSGNSSNNASITINTTAITGGSGNYPIIEFINDATGNIVQSGTNNTYTETDSLGGTYTIIAYDDKGCNATTTANIAPFDELLTIDISVDEAVSCVNAGEDISIQATGTLTNNTANPANYEYRLLPNAAYTNENEFKDLTPNSYNFEVRNIVTGCTLTLRHTVIEPNSFDIIVTKINDAICFGENGEITLSIVDATYIGGFSWQIFDTNGTPGVAIESGNSANIGPTGTIAVPAGSYLVEITQDTAPECAQLRAFTISGPEAEIIPNVSLEQGVNCSDNAGSILVAPTGGLAPYSIVLTNTTTPNTYSQNGVNAHLFTSLNSGSYDVQITDALGCTRTFTNEITLIRPDAITATIAASTLECAGDKNAIITTAIAPRNVTATYTYSLLRYLDLAGTTLLQEGAVQSDAIFNNLGSGFYRVSVKDEFNCSTQTNIIEIVEPTEISSLLTRTSPLSCLNGAELLLTPTGGTAPYMWSGDGINYFAMNEQNAANTHTFTNMPAGVYRYYVKDFYECVSIQSNEISEDAIIPLTIVLDTSSAFVNCNGEASATIQANADGGLGNYQYGLFTDAGLTDQIVPYQTDGRFSNLPQGSYYINVLSEDCQVTSELVTITDPEVLEINYTVTEITCNGEEDGSIVLTASGGTGIFKYAISPKLNQFDDKNSFDKLAAGDYSVIVQDSNGCFELIEFTITEPEKLAVDLIVTPEFCSGEADGTITIVPIGGTGPYSTSLNSNADTDYIEGQFAYTNLAIGDYIVFIKDANGCETNQIATIDQGVNINAQIEVFYDCSNLVSENTIEVTLEDRTERIYLMYALDSTDPNDLQLTTDFPGITTGSHTLTIAHENGCVKTIPFEVESFEPLTIGLEQLNLNEITATAEGGREDYTFYFNDVDNGNDNTYSISKTGTYTVTVVDANGCEAVSTIYMEFIDIEIPNFFTPDGDGLNEYWIPRNIDHFPNLFLKVYDRYGRYVFDIQDNPAGWDGLYKEIQMPTGDYWYVIKLNGEDDTREFIGHFTLYR